MDEEATKRQILFLAKSCLDQKAQIAQTCIAVDSLAWLSQKAKDDQERKHTVQLLETIARDAVNRQKQFDFGSGVLLAASLLKANLEIDNLLSRIDFDPSSEFSQKLAKGHDDPAWTYPIAEACLTLYQSGKGDRWMEMIEKVAAHSHSQSESIKDAETFGRAIHFLERASSVLDRPEYRDQAKQIAKRATKLLHDPENGMFRSRLGGKRCDVNNAAKAPVLHSRNVISHDLYGPYQRRFH